MTLLLAVIFISFIGLGLPDSALGTAWPAIYTEFALPVSTAGYISLLVGGCTVISGFFGARLIAKWGTGKVTAVSTLMTALALFVFVYTKNPVLFFLLAIPLGLGAGCVDAGLNSFVALHYSASQLNYLQCFYGIGVSLTPYLMALALGQDNNWRNGYLMVAIIQSVITVITFAALPLWEKMEKRLSAKEETPAKILKLSQMLKISGVGWSCMGLLVCCGIELTAGGWISTYFVNRMEIPASHAAAVTMLYYIGLSIGRFVSGLLASKLTHWQLLGIFSTVMAVAVVGLCLPFGTAFAAVCVFLLGLGIGPVFPNFIHLAPQVFGRDIASSVISMQTAATYIGIMLLPTLCGALAQRISMSVIPLYLLAMCILFLLSLSCLRRAVTK